MADKALYVLAGYDAATEEKLCKLQQKLYDRGFAGTHTKGIPMHITMGSFPCSEQEALKERLQSIAADIEAFPVKFNHVGIFGGGKVLFLCPDADQKMLELKERFGTSFGWTAHTTMLIDEPLQVLEALPILLQDFSAFEGEMTSLHLYEFFPTRHILTINLK